ncbi:MAG: alpha/beta hydrolase, partial [Gemmatimonas sp.]
RMALGGEPLDKLAEVRGHSWRSAPLVIRDLFRAPNALAAPIRVARNIRFAVVEGDTLTLDVYRPSAPGLFPVLVQIYGGAWQRGTPANNGEFAEYIAAQGYVVFAIDYRHAPQFRFPAQVDDVRNALAWIGRNADAWSADTSRMVLIGRSAGAHLAMMAAYTPGAPRVRGVIDYYGPVDLVEGYRQIPNPDPLRVRAIEEAFLGAPPDAMLDRYMAASPISLVTRRLPPTLLIYGGRDHIVEPRFGTMLAGRLQAEGTTVVHVEIPWAEHAFDAVPYGPSGQLARYITERFLAWATAN